VSPGGTGGYNPHSLLTAFWVPSGATSAIEDTDLSASGGSYGSIPSFGWPSPIKVVAAGAMSPLHNGYPGGIPGGDNTAGFEFSSLLPTDATVPVTVQMPSDWPQGVSSGHLVVYYGDGIDRYDAQSISVSLAASAQCSPPSFPMLTDTTDGTQNAPGGSDSVVVGGLAGEKVALSVSSGTFADGSTSETVTIGSGGTTSVTVDETTGAASVVTAKACGASATDTLDWAQPTLTLSANPTSLTVGGTSALTVTASGPIGSDQEIYVHDLSGDSTLSGTNVQGLGVGADSGTVDATDSTAQTVDYVAAVSEPGTTVHSNEVAVTWNSASAQCSPPSFPMLTDTTDGTQSAPGGSDSVVVGGLAGEKVALSVSSGTFADGSTSETVTIGSGGTTSVTVDETTGAASVVTATACGAPRRDPLTTCPKRTKPFFPLPT
jgi:hypothetical protein